MVGRYSFCCLWAAGSGVDLILCPVGRRQWYGIGFYAIWGAGSGVVFVVPSS